ncbi:MAG: gluconeogenesis factor YvcK family protein [Acidobacteriota bacterium]
MKKRLLWVWSLSRAGRWWLIVLFGLISIFISGLALTNHFAVDFKWIPRLFAVFILIVGAALTIYGFLRGIQGIVDSLSPFTPFNVYEFLQKDIMRKKGPHIVVVGGGTGLSVLLKGLKKYTNNLTAVVTVSDDGGSSGRLRDELGILPPGDIRNCLVALAETENLMDEVFQHRFQTGSLQGHNLGNLLLTALSDITGDFLGAIKEVSKVLAVRGQVLPATLDHVTLKALMDDGEIVLGETAITRAGKQIKEITLVPEDCKALPDAVHAIMGADAVVLGPGSLFTSIIPNLLVKEIGDALRETAATRIFVVNIMTQHGETAGYNAINHLEALNDHIGDGHIQYVIINNAPIDEERLSRYQEEGAMPVGYNAGELAHIGAKPVLGSFLGQDNVARHDPDRLARAIMRILYRNKGLSWLG